MQIIGSTLSFPEFGVVINLDLCPAIMKIDKPKEQSTDQIQHCISFMPIGVAPITIPFQDQGDRDAEYLNIIGFIKRKNQIIKTEAVPPNLFKPFERR